MQFAPGASPAPPIGQVVDDWIKSPINFRLVKCSVVAVWAFVIVRVLKALVVPTGAEKFVIDTGEMVTGALPEPIRLTVCGLPGASSLTVSVAVLVPDAVGVKVTDSGQLPVAARVAGDNGQVVVTAKSFGLAPAIAGGEMVSAMLCLFVSVTVCAALVNPKNWAVNDSVVGCSCTG